MDYNIDPAVMLNMVMDFIILKLSYVTVGICFGDVFVDIAYHIFPFYALVAEAVILCWFENPPRSVLLYSPVTRPFFLVD